MPMTPHSLLKNQTSVIEIFKVFDKFSKISDLKKLIKMQNCWERGIGGTLRHAMHHLT